MVGAKTVKVTITIKDGKAVVDVAGAEGSQCDLTQAIQDAIGQTTSTQRKPEYLQDNAQSNQQQQW